MQTKVKPLASSLSELRVGEGSGQRGDGIQFKCDEGAGLKTKTEGGIGPGSVEAQIEMAAVWVATRVRFWTDLRSRTRRICWWRERKVGQKERTQDGSRSVRPEPGGESIPSRCLHLFFRVQKLLKEMFPIEAGDINPQNRIIPHLPGEEQGPLARPPWPAAPQPHPPPPAPSGTRPGRVLTGPLLSLLGPSSPTVVRRAAGRREPPGHPHRVLQCPHEPAGQDLPLSPTPRLLQGAPR